MQRRTVLAAILLYLTATCAARGQSPPYRLGPEDVICVSVLNHQEFSGEFLIPQDGMLDLPSVGRMKVAGLALEELSRCVTDGLRTRLLDPEVTVTLKTPRMQRVFVLGAVAKPGLYDMRPGWRITEALAAAGGLIPQIEAAECNASVLSATTGERQTKKLSDVMRGDTEANLAVESGDVITIEAEERLPIYVMGKVKSPGIYPIPKESAGIIEAITMAGGVLEDSAVSRVTVTHVNGRSETVDLTSAITKGEGSPGFRLVAGDLVMVPEVTARIAVLGHVRDPGFFTLRDGQKLTLSDALSLAKGVDYKEASINSVIIVRTKDGKQERLICDMRKFFKDGDQAGNPEVVAGDVVYVPKGSKPDWSVVFSAISAVGWLVNPFVK